MGMILGEATIRANGVELKTKGGAMLNPGGHSRQVHSGGGKHWGVSQKTVPPSLEFTLAADEDVDVMDINAMTDATINFDGNNGLSYMLTGCATEEPATLSEEGDIKGKFIGLKCVKV